MTLVLTYHLASGSSDSTVGQWGKLLTRVMDDEGLATGLGGAQKYVRVVLWGYPVIVAFGLCWVDEPTCQLLVLLAMIWHLGWCTLGITLQGVVMGDWRLGHNTWPTDIFCAVSLGVRLYYYRDFGIEEGQLMAIAIWGCLVVLGSASVCARICDSKIRNRLQITKELVVAFDTLFESEGHSKGLIWPDGAKYPRGYIPDAHIEREAEEETSQLLSRNKAA